MGSLVYKECVGFCDKILVTGFWCKFAMGFCERILWRDWIIGIYDCTNRLTHVHKRCAWILILGYDSWLWFLELSIAKVDNLRSVRCLFITPKVSIGGYQALGSILWLIIVNSIALLLPSVWERITLKLWANSRSSKFFKLDSSQRLI